MADNGIRIESVETALRSEIGPLSAKMMKIQYQSDSVKNSPVDTKAPPTLLEHARLDPVAPGPNALISLTKITTRTPREEVKNLLKEDPGREGHVRNHDFYTIVFITRIQTEDPSTTRFINGTMEFVFPPDVKILEHSPKERGIVAGILKKKGTGISLSPKLNLLTFSPEEDISPYNPEKPFEFRAGADAKITGSYSEKSGHYFSISPDELFEYITILKNDHEVYGEIYPPVPSSDIESNGRENYAIISLIVQTPRGISPVIQINIDTKVKGKIWGVILLKSRVIFSKR
ncbi:MAG: hypothetical protein LUQ54_02750 [Methanoregula sp.]|nr:hypothetical protein [Methanoregula sp.]